MIKVKIYPLNSIKDDQLDFVVIMSELEGKWIYVKHKERTTWEIPGGHREVGESIEEAAARELYEETGAKEFQLTPVCIYSVERHEKIEYTESFGQLYYANVQKLDEELNFEIEKIKLFSDVPDELTYPFIQPELHHQVVVFKGIKL